MPFRLYAHRHAVVERGAYQGVEPAMASVTLVMPGSEPPRREPGLYIELTHAAGAQQLICIPPENLDELSAGVKALMAVRDQEPTPPVPAPGLVSKVSLHENVAKRCEHLFQNGGSKVYVYLPDRDRLQASPHSRTRALALADKGDFIYARTKRSSRNEWFWKATEVKE